MKETKQNKNYEILIVDDIPANLELLSNILYSNGLDISFADSGQQALESVAYQAPDLILLDISMPEMDGYEVCRRLKQNPETKDIPVIFLTALSDTENIVKGFQVGGHDYVTKPFNSEELLARVNTHLELQDKKNEVEVYAEQLLKLNNKQMKLNEKLNEQKAVIEQKNKDLTASIDYAKIIQNSLLPAYEHLKNYFNESFIIYIPKDIVSGDFYYFQEVDNKKIMIAADCTGHGVPGALISMLGISLLNQIILHEKNTLPSKILKKLDQEFTSMLNNSKQKEKSKDGIDLAICVYDLTTHKLVFGGSKRPVYLIRNNELKNVKGSLHSIGGIYQTGKDYKDHKFEIKKGDTIFIFSDGYPDQFGGKRYKKFTTKRFKKLLLEIHQKPMAEQRQILLDRFMEWKGQREQIDDVLVLGFRFDKL